MNMDIGLIGMSVMGSNLALNMADHGFKVAAYNRTAAVTKKVVEENNRPDLAGYYDLPSFVASLKKPRRIMLMIKAGEPVDQVIDELLPLLEAGDIIIDGGNSFFKDTIRRSEMLKKKHIEYFGMGISGGEEGARRGPAIMPGGSLASYQHIKPIFEAIAAHVGQEPCCAYIGPDGAGHYVKMVHNGIEYADMQLIAEAYLLLSELGGKKNKELAELFHAWGEEELSSYLIDITANILAAKDDDGKSDLLDKIADCTGQKGTGRWTSIQSLEQGADVSIITAACNARILSNFKERRCAMQAAIKPPQKQLSVGADFADKVRRALYIGKIVAYAQGFGLYANASKTYGWQLKLAEIASIFRGGCIIQAKFLDRITAAYNEQPSLDSLLLAPFFLKTINEDLPILREVVSAAVLCGLPIPALSNAISYIDSCRSEKLGANLVEAQRDYFGAHKFQRIDKEGYFHHQWEKIFD